MAFDMNTTTILNGKQVISCLEAWEKETNCFHTESDGTDCYLILDLTERMGEVTEAEWEDAGEDWQVTHRVAIRYLDHSFIEAKELKPNHMNETVRYWYLGVYGNIGEQKVTISFQKSSRSYDGEAWEKDDVVIKYHLHDQKTPENEQKMHEARGGFTSECTVM